MREENSTLKNIGTEEIVKFDKYFKSGNSIPVERAVIPASEWEKVKKEIKMIVEQLARTEDEIKCEERRFSDQQDLLHDVSVRAEQAEKELADLRERYECKADALNAAMLTIDAYEKEVERLKTELSRYKNAVEVEGLAKQIGQNVKVLILKEEEE